MKMKIRSKKYERKKVYNSRLNIFFLLLLLLVLPLLLCMYIINIKEKSCIGKTKKRRKVEEK